MPRLIHGKVLRDPADIADRCKAFGMPIEDLPIVDNFVFSVTCGRTPPVPNKRPWAEHAVWKHNANPKSGRYPYPPGVELFSPEYFRLRTSRQEARRRTRQQGVPLFMEGYHDLATYKPILSPKRADTPPHRRHYTYKHLRDPAIDEPLGRI